jgi:hypothetical protein
MTFNANNILQLEDAQVVVADYSSGGHLVLKGEDILTDIISSGQSENVRLLRVPVVNTDQAEVLAAALEVIKAGNMTEHVAENAAIMFNTAAAGPLRFDDNIVLDGSHRSVLIKRLLN